MRWDIFPEGRKKGENIFGERIPKIWNIGFEPRDKGTDWLHYDQERNEEAEKCINHYQAPKMMKSQSSA